MSQSSRNDIVGQGRFKILGKFQLKIPEQGFGSRSRRNGFHKSFITNDLAWTLTWTTPGFDRLLTPSEKPLCPRRCNRHDA
jgi:hypothetical protein